MLTVSRGGISPPSDWGRCVQCRWNARSNAPPLPRERQLRGVQSLHFRVTRSAGVLMLCRCSPSSSSTCGSATESQLMRERAPVRSKHPVRNPPEGYGPQVSVESVSIRRRPQTDGPLRREHAGLPRSGYQLHCRAKRANIDRRRQHRVEAMHARFCQGGVESGKRPRAADRPPARTAP
jgi:hypothetical protein